MTPQEINIAIAEATGANKFVGLKKRGLWYRPDAKGYTGCECSAGRYTIEEAKEHEYVHGEPDDVTIVQFPPPDYGEDLNAMNEAENTLPKDRRELFVVYLYCIITGTMSEPFPTKTFEISLWMVSCLLRATAQQRAEAFLRTIGKWKE